VAACTAPLEKFNPQLAHFTILMNLCISAGPQMLLPAARWRASLSRSVAAVCLLALLRFTGWADALAEHK